MLNNLPGGADTPTSTEFRKDYHLHRTAREETPLIPRIETTGNTRGVQGDTNKPVLSSEPSSPKLFPGEEPAVAMVPTAPLSLSLLPSLLASFTVFLSPESLHYGPVESGHFPTI